MTKAPSRKQSNLLKYIHLGGGEISLWPVSLCSFRTVKACVARSWIEEVRPKDVGYVKYRITDAGRRAIGVSDGL